MISFLRKITFSILLAGSMAACGTKQPQPSNTGNAIYYWRTTFALDSIERDFLQRHNIERIYLRMFDVAAELNPETDGYEAVPIATTRFPDDNDESAQTVPEGIEIVPTVYITLDALRTMQGEEAKYAELMVERLRAMASYNKCGKIREMQFDCDWTASTRASFVKLCSVARERLHADTIALSATIRLHQLAEKAPPVDCGVLMLYNTGALKNPDTHNSILDIKDVRPYLRKRKCNIPLGYAYPTFGWGVRFHDGKFQRIVSRPEVESLDDGDTIRIERPTADEILEVKSLVEKELGLPSHRNILYHLDNEQLKYYTDDEITKIYARR